MSPSYPVVLDRPKNCRSGLQHAFVSDVACSSLNGLGALQTFASQDISQLGRCDFRME